MTDEVKFPKRGDIWCHANGTPYEVVGYSVNTKTGNREVVYRTSGDAGFENMFTRELGEFVGYTNDHRPRFHLIGASQ